LDTIFKTNIRSIERLYQRIILVQPLTYLHVNYIILLCRLHVCCFSLFKNERFRNVIIYLNTGQSDDESETSTSIY